ncbi:uncharacterized protein RMCC_2435 [Mycolicibacterium canariasense]|uniref:Uncharacterized protein n=1 Tax=Mycolicibacterium canariasense TaxID=228230 RepID=A0A100WCG9_MYCCR|nr:hypothetical protein [Mycolicibacterium canariasense]MCV7212658.1 hypothetical protein [Mycolicibacterium canariasense]ORV02507.1 hypothetical protein AWB94_00780 [Mycolicibacterium canariasense]GAS95469.1 uncharacterized protein RMCC_2435 [Mycolicibacterium canariasense]
MSFRCINAFAYKDVVYPNGFQAEDDDPILKTHGEHFAAVDQGSATRAVEQAVARPDGLRAVPAKKAPAKKAAPKPGPVAKPEPEENN